MSKRDSFLKAIKERQQRQTIEDAQWLRERGIVPGEAPGSWEPMGMGQHFKQMLVGSPTGQRQSGEFLGKLPAAYTQEYQKMMPLGDVPIRDKRGRVVEWRSRGEFEQPILDPVQRGSADLALILADLADPTPGGEARAIKRAAILGGSEAGRAMFARVLNLGRKHLKGEARKALLDRLKRGVLFTDVPGRTVPGKERALADITFDVPLSQRAEEVKALSKRDVERLQTLIRRQREGAERLYKRMEKTFDIMGESNLPPFVHTEPTMTRQRVGMAGPHPESSEAHEVLGHIPEFGAPAMTRARMQHYAERAAPTRPEMEPYEQPVYWLQEWMAGKRPTGVYTLERLKQMQAKGMDVPKEALEQAKLREALELYGYDVAGLEGAIPQEPLFKKMQRR